MAFWVFFSFKGWKRLLFSEGPRQAINGLTVFSVVSTRNYSLDLADYASITRIQWIILGLMATSLLIWFFSFVRLALACLCYVPLVCYIGGGLDRYVRVKVDRRIAKIMERNKAKRVALYVKRNRELYSTKSADVKLKKKQKGVQVDVKEIERPTLPVFTLDDEDWLDWKSTSTKDKAGDGDSIFTMSTNHSHAISEPLPLYRYLDRKPYR